MMTSTLDRSREALSRAIKLAGGQSALARAIGVSQTLVGFWLMDARKGVGAEYVLKIEKLTGVSRYELRPDVFGDPPSP